MRTRTLCLSLSMVLALPLACGDDTGTQGTGAGGGTTTAGNNSGAGTTGGNDTGGGTTTAGNTSIGGGGDTSVGGNTGGENMGGSPLVIAYCGGQHLYECGNLLDDDEDGLIDVHDPDCLGPCDNDEGSLASSIPGGDSPVGGCNVDCYWDSNTGHGNDDCYWDHRCDPNSIDPNYYPEPAKGDQCAYMCPGPSPEDGCGENIHEINQSPNFTCGSAYDAQLDACAAQCSPLTPNGCDCFGCCELPAGTGKFVFLGSIGDDMQNPTKCTMDQIENPELCHPCLPVKACLNDCDPCEICIGQPEPDPSCDPGGEGGGGNGSGGEGSGGGPTGSQCPDGIQPCGLAGQDPCGFGYYCVTGCCQLTDPE